MSHTKVSNGYYQTTTIEIEGLQETCYGTLLAKKSGGGNWSIQVEHDVKAPEEVKAAFKEYEDSDHFLYFNYFQDVSEGLLYWPDYPPEEFKLLLYFPSSDTFISTSPTNRYALNSKYIATIKNDTVELRRNYNYLQLIGITILRIIILTLVASLLAILIGRPLKMDLKYIFMNNLIFQTILNIIITFYSYKNGFTVVEYISVVPFAYIIMFFPHWYIYHFKTKTMNYPVFSAFFSLVGTYAVGYLLVDLLGFLYMIF